MDFGVTFATIGGGVGLVIGAGQAGNLILATRAWLLADCRCMICGRRLGALLEPTMTLDLKIPPPIVGLALALVMWCARLDPALPLPADVREVLVGLCVAVGLGFDAMALLVFMRSKTTVNPLTPARTSALVTRGVYRVTRNPMYLGMALVLLGWGFYLNAWLALLGPVAFVAYITRFQILPEERVMAQHFGEAYTRYCARVRRWL